MTLTKGLGCLLDYLFKQALDPCRRSFVWGIDLIFKLKDLVMLMPE